MGQQDSRKPDEKEILPMVSVVVPTHNRRVMLQAGLESLLQQTYPRDRYEVIVVDDGSSDDTQTMVQGMQERSNGLIHYLYQEQAGPAMARDRGFREGRGEVIAFIDSDCTAHSGWLEQGVRTLQKDEKLGLLSGRVDPMPDRQITFFSRIIHQEAEHPFYQTCNIFYRRKALEQVGGFNPFFRYFKHFKNYVLGGEDTDLAWRVKDAGWKSGFADGALVYHEVERLTPFQYLRFDPGRSRLLPYLLARIPKLRDYMFKRYFLTLDTALFDLLVVGLVSAATVHPAGLVLGLPFSCRIALAVRQHKKRKLLKFAFYHAYFASVFLNLAYGSIKYRRLLL